MSVLQAVWIAVTGWIVVTLVGAQNTPHHYDSGQSQAALILFSLPGHEVRPSQVKG